MVGQHDEQQKWVERKFRLSQPTPRLFSGGILFLVVAAPLS